MDKPAKTLSILQITNKFLTEDKSVKWLEQVRWGKHQYCPHCGGLDNINPYSTRKYTYWHKDCRKAFTVKTDTVMHSSKLPVKLWAITFYYVLTARKGISSLQLGKELGITQKTGWFLLQRVREACTDKSYKLQHVVEMDEAFVGGLEANKHNSKRLKNKARYSGKSPVFGMKQRNGTVKLFALKNISKKKMEKLIRDNVEGGTSVFTDRATVYKHIEGFDWEKIDHAKGEYVREEVYTNSIESVWAILKRAHKGIYHHLSKKHLQRYMNEIAFRLNDGNVAVDTMDRMVSLGKSVSGKRLSYKDLIKN